MNRLPQVPDDASPVYALVVAAGSASRFGSTKQTAEYDGVPLVRRAVATANEACGEYSVLVTGHDRHAVVGACEPLYGDEYFNEHYRDGLGTSIACGVRRIRDSAAAVIVLLADQPLVTADHVRALIHAWKGKGVDIVATAFADTLGPPVLFGPSCFDALCDLQGDTGAKQLFTDDRFVLTAVPFEAAAIDVDTPEDLDA